MRAGMISPEPSHATQNAANPSIHYLQLEPGVKPPISTRWKRGKVGWVFPDTDACRDRKPRPFASELCWNFGQTPNNLCHEHRAGSPMPCVLDVRCRRRRRRRLERVICRLRPEGETCIRNGPEYERAETVTTADHENVGIGDALRLATEAVIRTHKKTEVRRPPFALPEEPSCI